MARQAYYKTHQLNIKQEGSDDLSSTFWQMTTSANLLGTEIHKVQENWGGRRDLWATNWLTKFSSKDIHFFRIVAPTKSPRNGFGGHPLTWQSGLTFSLWCGKGQNEGTLGNHLQTMHYHLGLICTCCLNYFTVSADAMHWHTQLCKSMAAGDNHDGGNLPETMRKMKMAMMTSNLHLKRTSLPHRLHIPSNHGQLVPLHQCPFQGRPFFPRPSGDSNYSFIPTVLVLTHYSVHLTMFNAWLLGISPHSITNLHYVINGSHVKYLPLCFVLIKRQ